jgi:hypothetical protein
LLVRVIGVSCSSTHELDTCTRRDRDAADYLESCRSARRENTRP